MTAPEGAIFGPASAGIEILGEARGNVVERNRIRGRARVALSVAPDSAGVPAGNMLAENDHTSLIASPQGARKQ